MKKIKTMAICALALAAMSFTAAAIDPVEQAAVSISKTALTNAVELGYISAEYEQDVLDSGIVEAMAKTLVESDYDLAATVDCGAEIAVERGWFRDKATAKRALRKAIDQARKNPGTIDKVYSLLGI